jgi:hypothetical protein
MSQVGTFDISPTSSLKRSTIDNGYGAWSAISSFEPWSGAVSCKNSTSAGEVGISEVSGYVMIETSSNNSRALGYKSSRGVTM